jgi:hypothetical protein
MEAYHQLQEEIKGKAKAKMHCPLITNKIVSEILQQI